MTQNNLHLNNPSLFYKALGSHIEMLMSKRQNLKLQLDTDSIERAIQIENDLNNDGFEIIRGVGETISFPGDDKDMIRTLTLSCPLPSNRGLSVVINQTESKEEKQWIADTFNNSLFSAIQKGPDTRIIEVMKEFSDKGIVFVKLPYPEVNIYIWARKKNLHKWGIYEEPTEEERTWVKSKLSQWKELKSLEVETIDSLQGLQSIENELKIKGFSISKESGENITALRNGSSGDRWLVQLD